MSFDSLTYLIFLPVVAILYRILPKSLRPILLLLASAVFYASWNLPLTLLLYGVIALTYAAGRLLGRTRNATARRAILWATTAILIGLLLYFKYFGFLAKSVMTILRLFGGDPHWQLWDILLPVGISFYTFQALSYVIDVYRHKRLSERSFGYYALYISFFPQLVAGPIERADALLPQLRETPTATSEDVRIGIRLLLSGYCKKIVLADFCGIYVDRVYGAALPEGFSVSIATLLFALQIYCDFAGYSEIARGSARLLGIRLMQNFDRPYLAENPRQFWRRWHISLSGWLTDYVYIPLGGSRHGILRQIAATMLVFLLSGLWHGANSTFIVWGLCHGILVVGWTLLERNGIVPRSKIAKACSVLVTFLLVTLLWVFFRAQSFSQALLLLRAVFTHWELSAGVTLLGMNGYDVLRLVLSLALFPLIHRLQKEERHETPVVYLLLIAVIGLAWGVRLADHASSAFLYFQF